MTCSKAAVNCDLLYIGKVKYMRTKVFNSINEVNKLRILRKMVGILGIRIVGHVICLSIACV